MDEKMKKLKVKHNGKSGPEYKVQQTIIKMMRRKGWFVKVVPGSAFLSGMPDLFTTHKIFGIRLVEVKLPKMKGSRFTKAQLETFPLLTSHGAGVWVLTSDSDTEYAKLKQPPNWYKYLKIMK
ncbi:MAG: hypothetical protein D4S01_00740 [Dehalococcoidia bacterium]|nr:MAG: hypothetical protein D4S01_00740 [Dehalococcoidia bacterium]